MTISRFRNSQEPQESQVSAWLDSDNNQTLLVTAGDLRLLCSLGLYRAVKSVSFPVSVQGPEGVSCVSQEAALSTTGKQRSGTGWPPPPPFIKLKI